MNSRRRETAKTGVQGLGPIPLTMMIPLWARATETKRASPILADWTAVSTAGSVDFDFERLRLPNATLIGACARTAIIDGIVRDCCAADPRLMLVNIGEGLDNRFGRVDNGLISCLDLDLPEVIGLRSKVAPETRRRRLIAKSVLDHSWMDEVGPGFQTVVLVAEGVLMYLPLEDVRSLFARAASRFPGSRIVFDSLSPTLARFGGRIEMGRKSAARYRWAIQNAAEIENWGEYKLIERRSVFIDHRRHFSLFVRMFTRFIPAAAWAHSINYVRLGA
jgi:O-methyltransferase involved in polyketide biosynthesis